MPFEEKKKKTLPNVDYLSSRHEGLTTFKSQFAFKNQERRFFFFPGKLKESPNIGINNKPYPK